MTKCFRTKASFPLSLSECRRWNGEDYTSSFKRPRLNSFTPSTTLERRESQASTASSTSFSVSGDSEDVDVRDHLNNALESNSETEDDSPQRANFASPAFLTLASPV